MFHFVLHSFVFPLKFSLDNQFYQINIHTYKHQRTNALILSQFFFCSVVHILYFYSFVSFKILTIQNIPHNHIVFRGSAVVLICLKTGVIVVKSTLKRSAIVGFCFSFPIPTKMNENEKKIEKNNAKHLVYCALFFWCMKMKQVQVQWVGWDHGLELQRYHFKAPWEWSILEKFC